MARAMRIRLDKEISHGLAAAIEVLKTLHGKAWSTQMLNIIEAAMLPYVVALEGGDIEQAIQISKYKLVAHIDAARFHIADPGKEGNLELVSEASSMVGLEDESAVNSISDPTSGTNLQTGPVTTDQGTTGEGNEDEEEEFVLSGDIYEDYG